MSILALLKAEAISGVFGIPGAAAAANIARRSLPISLCCLVSLLSVVARAQSMDGSAAGILEGMQAPQALRTGQQARQPFDGFRVSATSVLDLVTPVIDVGREVETRDLETNRVAEALNFNLGVRITPIEGLNLQADAWRQQLAEAPAVTVNTGLQPALPGLYSEDPARGQFGRENPSSANQLRSSGFDLGASYVWDTDRFGQFTLSTKTTYVESLENGSFLQGLAGADYGSLEDRVISPELQSSLMLTWQLGNHTATAITKYFDSFQDLSELDVEQINDLVDNITTVDLRYGYSIETGSSNRAIISFGIRNLFDEKTAQILNSSTRILDQNGRIAYGSIKYQF